MKYHFRVHKEKTGGFWAEGIELTGCASQGKNLSELKINITEALNIYLAEPESSSHIFPLPRKKMADKKNIIQVEVEPGIAFSVMLKKARLERKLTQKQAAKLLGITGSLYKYQRLEDPKNSNPELKTLVLVKRAFPEIELDLLAA